MGCNLPLIYLIVCTLSISPGHGVGVQRERAIAAIPDFNLMFGTLPPPLPSSLVHAVSLPLLPLPFLVPTPFPFPRHSRKKNLVNSFRSAVGWPSTEAMYSPPVSLRIPSETTSPKPKKTKKLSKRK